MRRAAWVAAAVVCGWAFSAAAEVGEDPHLAEAQALGIVDVIARSNLSSRQKPRLAAAIVREAKKAGIDPLLVVAVIRVESAFNAYAVSPVGAMGLMQVMPETGRWLLSLRGEELGRPQALFDFELNVELGASYLGELIQRFGSVEQALVAYNAGPTKARRILARKEVSRRFLAGYPSDVLHEHRRLVRAFERAQARRVAQGESAGAGLGGGR